MKNSEKELLSKELKEILTKVHGAINLIKDGKEIPTYNKLIGISQKIVASVTSLLEKKERDEEVAKVANELNIVFNKVREAVNLIKAGREIETYDGLVAINGGLVNIIKELFPDSQSNMADVPDIEEKVEK